MEELSKSKQKMMDRVLKVKPIQRDSQGVGILNALKMTWYLDSWISKLIFIYGGIALLGTIFFLLGFVF